MSEALRRGITVEPEGEVGLRLIELDGRGEEEEII